MKPYRWTIIGIVLLGPLLAMAHEPLFGLGPHTIYQYGLGIESEMQQRDSGWSNQLELIYGLTPEWAVTLAAPYLFATEVRSAGFGDITLRNKYRIFRADRPGASNQAALHLGIEFPTGAKANFSGLGKHRPTAGNFYGAGIQTPLLFCCPVLSAERHI